MSARWPLGGGGRRPAGEWHHVSGMSCDSGGGEERVDVGVASEVADDRSNGTDSEMKRWAISSAGVACVEVSTTDLVVSLGWGVEVAGTAAFRGASHGC